MIQKKFVLTGTGSQQDEQKELLRNTKGETLEEKRLEIFCPSVLMKWEIC